MRAQGIAPALRSQGGRYAGRHPANWRRHDADGISPEAYAVIGMHGLNKDRILDIAKKYESEKGDDFNRAPANDFRGAPLGENLVNMAYANPPFDAFRNRFRDALESSDYDTSDSIIDKCLRDGGITDRDGGNIYAYWKLYAERLEGLNAALFRVAGDASCLNRFIASLGELDNYRHGRWREEGDMQDRVPTTVGKSNVFLDKRAVAKVSYSAGALAGWTQPVRYSPYPRNTDENCERFGGEKDGSVAGECEVHVHAGCPIPAREHIKIALLPRCRLRRQDVVEQYGDVGVVE